MVTVVTLPPNFPRKLSRQMPAKLFECPVPLLGDLREFFKEWAKPGLFLFIFVLFKHKFYRKNCRYQQDSNSDRRNRRRACWPLNHHHGLSQRICYVTCNIEWECFISTERTYTLRPNLNSRHLYKYHMTLLYAVTLTSSPTPGTAISEPSDLIKYLNSTFGFWEWTIVHLREDLREMSSN